ncbi:MAG TPA: DUF222 domain-containing protein, partial [Acidimicrobiia bacterium]
ADDLAELELVIGLLEAERLRRIASFESMNGPGRFGYPSSTAFLKDWCRVGSGRAHRLVGYSRIIRMAPATMEAWTAGRLSADQVSALLDGATAVPDLFSPAEESLVDIVEDLGVSDTRRVLAYWRHTVDGPGILLDEVEQQGLRGVSASRSLNGMVRLDGWMTPVAGEALLTALDALMPPPGRGEERTPRQRRHDALEDLARSYLDSDQTAVVGGEKPHVSVVCDLPALQGIAGGLHETENGQLLTISQLGSLTCDCSLSRILLGPDGEIIDVGRKTRIIPAALRRGIIARDRHCTWTGCDRSPRWCDIHHMRHWANGGPTSPDNLTLICRYHHSLTHQGEGRDPPSLAG